MSISALATLREERDRMSAMDRRIADYILANAPLLRDYSSQQLADALKVSQSSIVKFAQRMGYKGYPDLKLSVTEAVALASTVEETTGRTEVADAPATRADDLWVAKTAADRQTRAVNDIDTVARIAGWLTGTDTLFLAGNGIDGDAAHTLASRVSLIGRRCIACRQPDELVGLLSAATSRDVLLVISGLGAGSEWMRACRSMRGHGGKVVAIVRSRQGGLSAVADAMLVVSAHAPQPHIEDLVYEAVMRQVLDDLFLRMLAGHPDATEAFAANRQRAFGDRA